MGQSVIVERKIHFAVGNKGKRKIKDGPGPKDNIPIGRIPRICR